MDEQRLWAPWRMSYIAGDKSAETTSQEPIAWLPGADHACFICKAAAAYADEAAARRQNLVLEVSNHAITLLNRIGDLLFAMARAANRAAGVADVPWVQG